MIEHALPLWSTEGWDRTSGGLSTGSRRTVDHLAPRRVFVQARQIYCFAKAAQVGAPPFGAHPPATHSAGTRKAGRSR
jgi:mannose/cellobiose epimerase-like protein (N-acyl-D-glucosamine 2-epimerase family)